MAVNNLNLLENFDYRKQLAFAYFTCERLYPNYVHFSRNFEFGDEIILRAAIDLIYGALLTTTSPSQDDIKSYSSKVESNTPNTEDFDTIFVSSALDSCTAILETLDFILDNKVSRLYDISSFAIDTVDMYVSVRDNLDFNNDSLFNQKIFDDPLMQREYKVQEGIISYLSKIGVLELKDINNLLSLQNNDNKSNIDL